MCFGVFICRLIVSQPIQFSVYLFRPCFPQSDSLVFQSRTMCSSSFKHGISSPYSAEMWEGLTESQGGVGLVPLGPVRNQRVWLKFSLLHGLYFYFLFAVLWTGASGCHWQHPNSEPQNVDSYWTWVSFDSFVCCSQYFGTHLVCWGMSSFLHLDCFVMLCVVTKTVQAFILTVHLRGGRGSDNQHNLAYLIFFFFFLIFWKLNTVMWAIWDKILAFANFW